MIPMLGTVLPILGRVLPGWTKYLALAVLVAGVWGHGWFTATRSAHEKETERRIKEEAHYQIALANHANASANAIAEYERKLAEASRSRTIVKEVPRYITVEADRACVVPRGFVRLHDAVAQGVLPGAPDGTDDAAADVEISTVAGTVIDNYGSCKEDRARLEALQSWVRSTTTRGEQK